ncbi:hypothetical protein BaRGS_00012189 [Batillaria attramentaria]|uniref:Uncharacterized protein n=1 Tax=Batillaria attramentaria TaxID=370345 RepID=A0ABD0LAY5_9CAEN
MTKLLFSPLFSQPTTVTTAIVSNDSEKRLMSSQSTRSVATPSKLQPELSSLPEGETIPSGTTPRRLPPLEASLGAESESSDGVSIPSRLPAIPEPDHTYENM